MNIDRKFKTSKPGEQLYKSKVGYLSGKYSLTILGFALVNIYHKNMSNEDDLIQIDRVGRKMTVVPVREEKDKSFQDCIVKNCLEFMEEDKIPEVDVSLFRIICFSELFFLLQYDIDFKLIEELAQKRKATFSKVRSLNKTVI